MIKSKNVLLTGAFVLCLLLSACTTGESGGTNFQTQNTTSTEQNQVVTTQTTENDTHISEENSLIVINNFNQELTYEEIPQRAITLSYGPTEIMVALGLEEHIIGIAEADNPIDIVYDQHKEAISQLKILASAEEGGVPTLEVVLAETPDFVYGSSFGFNADYGVGATEDFLTNDINIYASASTYADVATLEDTYNEILEIGRIFRVEESAVALVEAMKEKFNEVSLKVIEEEPVTALLYNSGTESPYVYFQDSFLSSLAEAAGATNALSESGSAARISMEAVIEANPDFIVVMEDTWQDVNEKIEYFKSRPELAEVTAIKEDNFVVVSLEYSCFSSLHNVDAVEIMARAFHPDCF